MRSAVLAPNSYADAAACWDGRSNAFTQFGSEDMALEDHGVFADPRDFYASPAYSHRVGFVPLSWLMGVYRLYPGRAWDSKINGRMYALRREAAQR